MSKLTTAIATLGVVAGLGVAALPLSSYAEGSAETTQKLKATIDESISIEATGSDAEGNPSTDNVVDLGLVTLGGNPVTGAGALKVMTNNPSGYTVSVKVEGADTNMNNVTTGGSGTIANGTPTKGTSAWGLKGGTGREYQAPFKGAYGAVTNADQAYYKTTAGSAADGDVIDTNYGVSASADQEAGVYEVELTFTAAVNNSVNPTPSV